MLLLLKILFGGVYKSRHLDSLESLFLFCLSFLSAVTLQLSNSKVAIYPSISVAFVLILGTFVYHIYFSVCTKERRNCTEIFSRKKFKFPWSNNYQHLDENLSLNSFETEYENASNLIDGLNENPDSH